MYNTVVLNQLPLLLPLQVPPAHDLPLPPQSDQGAQLQCLRGLLLMAPTLSIFGSNFQSQNIFTQKPTKLLLFLPSPMTQF